MICTQVIKQKNPPKIFATINNDVVESDSISFILTSEPVTVRYFVLNCLFTVQSLKSNNRNLIESMTSTSRNQLPNLYRVLVVLCLFSLSTQIALEPKVCLTQGCVHAASRMLEKMNQSADPCHDFYNYACGQFIADTIIPDSNAQVSMYTQLKDKVNHQIKALVSAPIEETEIEPFKKIKKFYASCLNFGWSKKNIFPVFVNIKFNSRLYTLEGGSAASRHYC